MVKPLKAIAVQGALINPDALHELIAPSRPHQLERRVIEKLKPMLVAQNPFAVAEQSAPRMGLRSH